MVYYEDHNHFKFCTFQPQKPNLHRTGDLTGLDYDIFGELCKNTDLSEAIDNKLYECYFNIKIYGLFFTSIPPLL